MQRIEVITGEQKRRRYTTEEKSRFVALSIQPGYSVSLVARQYGITPQSAFQMEPTYERWWSVCDRCWR